MGLGYRFLAILAFSIGAASSALAEDCDERLRALVARFPIIGTPSGIYGTSPGAFDASLGIAGKFGTALPVNSSLEQYRAAHGLEPPIPNASSNSDKNWKDFVQRQKDASVLGLPDYYYYSPMGEDYVALAIETLHARQAMLGDNHAYVREWLRNQRRAQCGSQPSCDGLPRLEGTYGGALQQLAEADVRYQEASAFMFRRDMWQAYKHFQAIAERKDDPWRARAAAQAVRALLLNSYPWAPKSGEEAHQALALTRQILADPSLSSIHPWANRELDVIAYRSGEPDLLDDQLDRLMTTLTSKVISPDWPEADAAQISLDLEYFLTPEMREPLGYWLRPTPAAKVRSEALRQAVGKWPLLDWLQADAAANWSRGLTWRRTVLSKVDDPLPEHAWRRIESDSVLWARPYALRAPADDTARDRLWQLYTRVEAMVDRCELPIEWAAVYDRIVEGVVRVSLLTNPDRVDDVLKRAKALPAKRRMEIAELARQSALLVGRMDLARRWAVHLGGAATAVDLYVARDIGELATAIEHMTDLGAPPTPRPFQTVPLGSRQAAAMLDLLPTAALLDAADRLEKPHPLRDAIIRAAWVRAWLLQDRQLLARASAKLSSLDPAFTRDLRAVDSAWTTSGAEQIRLLMVLRNPALTMRVFYDDGTMWRASGKPRQAPGEIDRTNMNDGNWWCSFDIDAARERIVKNTWFPATDWIEGANVEVLHDWAANGAPLLRLVDWKELDRLAAIQSAPKILADRTLAWARSLSWFDRLMGWDSDIPEALYLTVRATRWACPSDGLPHGRYSRRAFAYLHREYADSEWARKTKYWYGHLDPEPDTPKPPEYRYPQIWRPWGPDN